MASWPRRPVGSATGRRRHRRVPRRVPRGIGGRPIALVKREVGGDQSKATDCANELVQDGVVMIVIPDSIAALGVFDVTSEIDLPGTADLTPQMTEIADGDPTVVHIIGDEGLCIATINGLAAAGFDGPIDGLWTCVTDATKQAVGENLDGFVMGTPSPIGDGDNPDMARMLAIFEHYGADLDDPWVARRDVHDDDGEPGAALPAAGELADPRLNRAERQRRAVAGRRRLWSPAGSGSPAVGSRNSRTIFTALAMSRFAASNVPAPAR